MDNINKDFDIYELYYRSYTSGWFKINIDTNVQNVSENTVKFNQPTPPQSG
jgi:hypothetical protein